MLSQRPRHKPSGVEVEQLFLLNTFPAPVLLFQMSRSFCRSLFPTILLPSATTRTPEFSEQANEPLVQGSSAT